MVNIIIRKEITLFYISIDAKMYHSYVFDSSLIALVKNVILKALQSNAWWIAPINTMYSANSFKAFHLQLEMFTSLFS